MPLNLLIKKQQDKKCHTSKFAQNQCLRLKLVQTNNEFTDFKILLKNIFQNI